MILKWKGTGILAIATTDLTGTTIPLVPGANTLSDANWASIKDHPDVVKKLKANTLEVVESKKSDKTENSEEPTGEIGALNSKDAIALVGETHNTVELNKWKESETRAGVIKAIDKKLEEIAAEFKPKDA